MSAGVVGIVQARMGSTRLPGKVLMEAAGAPLIVHMLRRVRRARSLGAVWVATSSNSENDPLEEALRHEGVPVLRGSEDDVLSRFWQIANAENATWVVRLTGDCPMHDPAVIDDVVRYALDNADRYDYVANSLYPTFPDGLDVEVFTREALNRAYHEATTQLQREHVTPYIHRFHDGPGPFRVGHYYGPADFSHLRWTLDQPEDYRFIREVYERVFTEKPEFSWLDVLALLTRAPELLTYNGHITRNEGYLKALAAFQQRMQEREASTINE